jgi:hypothetical protein
MFEYKPDYDKVLDRFEEWWDAKRPLLSISYPRPIAQQIKPPAKHHADWKACWLDTQYQVEKNVARIHNTIYCAEALPVAYPNLGPDIFAAYYGCPLIFGETTSWSEPNLKDWSPASLATLKLDRQNFYFRKTLEYSEALIAAGRGRFIAGYTDMHSAGDTIAAFRDPQQLCLDLIDDRGSVKTLTKRITREYLETYDFFYDRLKAAGMPATTWMPAVCRGKFHIPSNDFACMISDEIYQEVFFQEVVDETAHMDRNIFHVDGPQNLRYMDQLLTLPNIHAIQWVPGAGHDNWRDWVPVYRKIQAAGKALLMYPPVQDLPDVFKALKPEGVWLSVGGVADRETAEAAMKAVSRWGR